MGDVILLGFFPEGIGSFDLISRATQTELNHPLNLPILIRVTSSYFSIFVYTIYNILSSIQSKDSREKCAKNTQRSKSQRKWQMFPFTEIEKERFSSLDKLIHHKNKFKKKAASASCAIRAKYRNSNFVFKEVQVQVQCIPSECLPFERSNGRDRTKVRSESYSQSRPDVVSIVLSSKNVYFFFRQKDLN